MNAKVNKLEALLSRVQNNRERPILMPAGSSSAPAPIEPTGRPLSAAEPATVPAPAAAPTALLEASAATEPAPPAQPSPPATPPRRVRQPKSSSAFRPAASAPKQSATRPKSPTDEAVTAVGNLSSPGDAIQAGAPASAKVSVSRVKQPVAELDVPSFRALLGRSLSLKSRGT